MKRMLNKLWIAVGLLATLPLAAQVDDKYKDYREVYRDSSVVAHTKDVFVEGADGTNPFEVVSNPFRQNWFVFGTAGAHTFRGDYSKDGPFMGTVSPDFSVGFGKWFMPWLALKAEFILSDSRGYTEYKTAHYGYGDWIEGNPGYRKMKTGWWDLGGSAIINLTRLYYGYEGYGARDHMGQLMAAAGIGAVHHMGYEHSYGSDNELSAHLELQYSQFFNAKKNVSLDLKARALLYQTNFDLEYGQADHAAQHVDANLGLNVGLTFYLGKKGANGWRRGGSTVHEREYKETQKVIMKVKEDERPRAVKSGTLTFFVFYPNNYSGRNDAPIVAGAPVNAIDYLAGGIFTQKQYTDGSLRTIVDLPTERADKDFAVDFVPRGYEMRTDQPLSLSLDKADMKASADKAGFWYAPIDDGLHTWQYRIDDATLRQQLVRPFRPRDRPPVHGPGRGRRTGQLRRRVRRDDLERGIRVPVHRRRDGRHDPRHPGPRRHPAHPGRRPGDEPGQLLRRRRRAGGTGAQHRPGRQPREHGHLLADGRPAHARRPLPVVHLQQQG